MFIFLLLRFFCILSSSTTAKNNHFSSIYIFSTLEFLFVFHRIFFFFGSFIHLKVGAECCQFFMCVYNKMDNYGYGCLYLIWSNEWKKYILCQQLSFDNHFYSFIPFHSNCEETTQEYKNKWHIIQLRQTTIFRNSTFFFHVFVSEKILYMYTL